ncbi:MAG: hypothetical protein KZQ92_13330 [Candidatus Thiodiazotropha sp. (ex Lucinoma borealis)]|nr:hypothetical protein [Candidatus Thiodiazotropha sp. (ex Lucinoma borealis)]MCU7855821.1 hypothetical protein [Candidatus Thiodiazotropha sp. (ex Lucinoma borealis)]MCU7864949.1 hypothetical protein [Candidatus Thiodiazotropha sp. (ex Lucinoma borealis)]MCU7868133.1 hypothetical protein [Candidatus Thiodiazotropha sp. (ex Lucinoma borealis)]
MESAALISTSSRYNKSARLIELLVANQKNMETKRIISGIIYLGTIILALLSLESKEIFMAILGTLIPVLMIWYPEVINDYTLGITGEGGTIDKPTPPFLISGVGWLVLLGIPLFILIS